METMELIKLEFASLRRQVDAVLIDLTDEQFNWNPPGMANSIRAALIHLIATEDDYVHAIILGCVRIWERDRWSERIGLSAPPSPSRGWDEIHQAHLRLEPVLGYSAAVRAAVDDFVEGLTPAVLDRRVQLYGRERPVAEVIIRLFIHSALHAGEIAAIRGLQGVKGLPV